MQKTQRGFTLIELLIVISIIGLLAAVLLPNILGAQDAAYAQGDQANLRRHFEWMTMYKSKSGGTLPKDGGYRFVMTTWTAGIYDHTPENLERFFTPGPARNDGVYADLRQKLESGQDPFPTLNDTTTQDTHYVGRAKEDMRSVENSADEAWMANDNEGAWSLRDGTVNILFNGGAVRSYSYLQLQELFGLGPMDKNVPVKTYGKDSPIPACQKLDN